MLLGGGFIIAVIVLLTSWAILNGRDDAHRTAEVANSNFSQALADNFNSVINQIDFGLLAVLDELSRQRQLGALDGDAIATSLARQDERHPEALGYQIFGSDGRLLYGVKNVGNSDADISQRDEFKYLRDHGDSGLLVSPPLMDMAAQQWAIVLERRITNADGSFGGVVSASIAPPELQKIFASLRIGASGVALLAHRNHKIAAWVPVPPGIKDPIGTEGISEKLRALIDSGVQEAQYDAASPVDGVNRAVHVRKIAGQSYYILVALAAEDYLSGWRHDSAQLLIFGAFMVGLTLAGMVTAHRRNLERGRAERIVEREKLRLLTVLKTASDGIHIMDSEGVLIEANDAFLNMLGYDGSVIGRLRVADWDVGHSWGELGTCPDGSVVRQDHEIFETRHLCRGGSVIDVEISSRRIEVDGKKFVYAASRDITERKAMELALKQSNAELEQFAYVASHDLRQPLRMVTNYLGLMEKRLGPQISEDLKAYFGFAVAGAKRMDQLIADLLQYSQTGRSPESGPVSLGQIVKDARQNLLVMIEESGAKITVQEPMPTIMGNPGETVRLFQNLICNAIKYRSPDRPPEVEIGWRRQDHDYLVWIKDNGMGIAPEDRDRVFQIFQRLVPRDACEGSGIGLAVCKKIVEGCGGNIWIESQVDAGSTFFMTFP